ncbi:cbb3-type cytochrome oxidase subunit 3 [Eoetvoesiella caeni]|uniref:Cytochrome c oxidase cbb3-type subunit 4 n=1 Tax=Eoetvoesiella caeni TaxID=645616 RepID=A0A366HKY7_9BURK|nr:CcoQ/FixQ family Cbb3-type cytochrome c oxidase assembly chaperone [Eoetvoesiella caeni]RBP43217.1 cytochrome c oxidase cbb3-type subunit 4 [Eoetvoesiella caeni]
MGVLNGIITAVALVTFIGIVWWAYSRGRAKDNTEASLLPFALPDEDESGKGEEGGEDDSSGPSMNDKKQGDTHE